MKSSPSFAPLFDSNSLLVNWAMFLMFAFFMAMIKKTRHLISLSQQTMNVWKCLISRVGIVKCSKDTPILLSAWTLVMINDSLPPVRKSVIDWIVCRSNLMCDVSFQDDVVRVWAYNPDRQSFSCVATGEGHTGDVAAIAFAKWVKRRANRRNPMSGFCFRTSNSFLVSGSQDTTVKVWSLENLDLDDTTDREAQSLSSLFTLKTHEKEVNSIAVASNDKQFATGSADKTAKVLEITARIPLRSSSAESMFRSGIWEIRNYWECYPVIDVVFGVFSTLPWIQSVSLADRFRW